jgi:hypothetical protein
MCMDFLHTMDKGVKDHVIKGLLLRELSSAEQTRCNQALRACLPLPAFGQLPADGLAAKALTASEVAAIFKALPVALDTVRAARSSTASRRKLSDLIELVTSAPRFRFLMSWRHPAWHF